MKSDLWKKVSEVFQSALRLEHPDRPAFVAKACGDNEVLRRQVKSLLEAHENAGNAGFIESPAVELAAGFLVDHEAEPGQIIEHYQILKLLGAGGMGEVYLADDLELKRPVAIKVLPAETAQDQDRIRRFAQEARAASALNHPNILTVYQVGDFKASRFIAMEFVGGRTLRDIIAEGPPALLNALDIAVQVAAALDAAHQAGIVHRDIKPENIMVRRDGLVKVLDFGLAKFSGPFAETGELDNAGPESETRDLLQTRPGTIMGTAAYMSPEQARGLPVDARSDIWSLGVLIYEMVAGRQPFSGETVSDTIAAILKTEPDPIRNTLPAVQRIISNALEKGVDERYRDMEGFLWELRELKQDLEFTEKLGRNVPAAVATRGGNVLSTGRQPRTTLSSVENLAQRIRSHKLPVAGVLLALIFSLSFFYYRDGGGVEENGPGAKVIDSIAVLPFVNADGGADIEYLTDGMTESLISSLSQLSNLTVTARNSVFLYKGKAVTPQTIGRELSVQAALFGRVSHIKDALTLSLELVDTKSGDRIWGKTYTRNQADLVAFQNEIARDVANRLGAWLSEVHREKAEKIASIDPEAYQLYLQGLYHLNKRSAEDIRKSIILFQQATERDPSFAKAYASLASAYITLRPNDAGLSREEMNELASRAEAAVLRAREIDESLPEVHAMLGTMNDAAYKFTAAEDEYRQAIELNPNDASARLSYSLNLSWRGRYDEALTQIIKAYELDPLSRSIAFNIGGRHWEARRYDQAIAQFKRVLEMEPKHALTHSILASTYEAKGMFTEAIPELRAADVLLEKTSPQLADRKAAALSRALKTRGARGYWQKRLEFCQQDYDKGIGLAYELATVLARLGERDRAMEQLERSFAAHEWYLPWIRTQSAFDPMKDDPRFQNLIQRLGLY